jgi:hypothetical protein
MKCVLLVAALALLLISTRSIRPLPSTIWSHHMHSVHDHTSCDAVPKDQLAAALMAFASSATTLLALNWA